MRIMSDAVDNTGNLPHDHIGLEDDWSDVDESLLTHCDADSTSASQNGEADHAGKFSSDPREQGGGGGCTPLQLFCKVDYLCVTDLVQQLWCEQHLSYTLMGIEPEPPAPLDGEKAPVPVPLPAADRPEVKAGKSVHLARELEVHDIVSVKISSKADKWAVQILNLLSAIRGFLAGISVAREVPIFGDPYGTGDLFSGIIDELRFDSETYKITLVELKTRRANRMPGKTQKRQHALQVQIYKQLWDNLVKGKFSPDFLLSKLSLTQSANQPLSEEVIKHIDASSVSSASSLKELLQQLVTSAQALVCIDSMEVEYVFQDTGAVIGQLPVEGDSDWLQRTFSHCMDYWHGRRETEGVEIEEAWKCRTCEFSTGCEWRIKKANALASKNTLIRDENFLVSEEIPWKKKINMLGVSKHSSGKKKSNKNVKRKDISSIFRRSSGQFRNSIHCQLVSVKLTFQT